MSSKADSIILKTDAYCDFYRTHRSVADFPAGWGEGAREAAKEKRLSFLRAMSRELDVRIRELLADSEQTLVAQEMIERGVSSEDLPNMSLPKPRAAVGLSQQGKI